MQRPTAPTAPTSGDRHSRRRQPQEGSCGGPPPSSPPSAACSSAMTPASSTAPCRTCRGPGLTPLTEGLVTSSLLFGAAFGALFGGRLADRNGRRKMIMVLAVIFLVGHPGLHLRPEHRSCMILARFVLGLAVGGASVTVPVYLAEVSPSARRGRIVTQNELMIVTGQLLAFIFNAYLGNTFGEAAQDLALDAGHRHPAGDRALDRDELHARKPALAGLDWAASAKSSACCSGSAPSPRPGRVRGSQGHGRGGLQVQDGLLAGPRACPGSAASSWWASAWPSSSRSPA